MRYWDRVQNPDVQQTRSRSTIYPEIGSAPAQWGQRPLFSEPGPDQPSPEEGRLATEVQLDRITPVDESEGSKFRKALVVDRTPIPVMFTISTDNVTSTPTDAELTAAFGPRPKGFAALINDNGGAGVIMLVIKGGADTWWFEILTKAT